MQSFLDSLKKSTKYYVVSTDLDGNYTYCNEHFLQTFGFTEEELIGKPYTSTLHPDDIDKCNEAAYACMIRRANSVRLDIRKPHPGKPGEYFITEWEFFGIIPPEETEVKIILSVGHDATDLREIEEIMQIETKQALETIFERITDGFFSLDTNFNFTYLNKASENLLLRRRADLINQNVWKEFPAAVGTDFEFNYKEAMRTQERRNFDSYYGPLDKHFMVSCFPSPSGLSVYFQDITYRKRYEEQLESKSQRLAEIAHLQSHKIRGPVASIIGLIHLLNENELNSDVAQIINALRQSSLKLDEIIHQIVELTEETKQ